MQLGIHFERTWCTVPLINKIFLPFFSTFSYDTRGQSHAEARHWSEEKILGGRAFFRGDLKPARLIIDNVKGTDAGEYRCRADFYRAPTTISHMKLDVIGTNAVVKAIKSIRIGKRLTATI